MDVPQCQIINKLALQCLCIDNLRTILTIIISLLSMQHNDISSRRIKHQTLSHSRHIAVIQLHAGNHNILAAIAGPAICIKHMKIRRYLIYTLFHKITSIMIALKIIEINLRRIHNLLHNTLLNILTNMRLVKQIASNQNSPNAVLLSKLYHTLVGLHQLNTTKRRLLFI